MAEMSLEQSRQIGECKVTVQLGDMTRIPSDAYVVPEFQGGASYGGVGGAIYRSGGGAGLDEFEAMAQSEGPFSFGTVKLTKSGGGNSKFLLHAVTVGSGAEREFQVVHEGFLECLRQAQANGISEIVAPALGTGIIGDLNATQSAKAMLSAVEKFTSEGGAVGVKIAIYGDRDAFAAYSQVLTEAMYSETDTKQGGQKLFDLDQWTTAMNTDALANLEFENRNKKE